MNTKLAIFLISLGMIGSAGLSYSISYQHYEVLEKTLSFEKQKLANLIIKKDILIARIQQQNHLAQLKISQFEDVSNKTILQNKSNKQLTSVTSGVNDNTAFQTQQCQRLMAQVDFSSLEQLSSNVASDDFSTQQRALKTLALIGSSEAQQKINQFVADERQDIDLRRELIKSTDWTKSGSKPLIDLFRNDTQSNIRTEIIASAESSHFTPEDKTIFENTLLDNLAQESNDVVKIATLDYFAKTNREQLNSVINTMNPQTLSKEIKNHIQSLEIPAQSDTLL